jgi:hypothetical protein
METTTTARQLAAIDTARQCYEVQRTIADAIAEIVRAQPTGTAAHDQATDAHEQALALAGELKRHLRSLTA